MTDVLAKLKARIKYLEQRNRWSAFTDDELRALSNVFWGSMPRISVPAGELREQITEEIERRRGDAAGTIAPNGDDLGSAQTPIPTSDAP